MATSMALIICERFAFKNILRLTNCGNVIPDSLRCRQYSSDGFKGDKMFVKQKPIVELSPDKSCILCWQPEQEIPYEFTKPMPRNETELQQGDSVLKVQYVEDERSRHSPDGPSQQELMKIFHTTRHAFDHKPSMRLRKKNPPKDRDRV